ncbi:hypothetical protein M413DRAFT_441548 [Hebeloma cylindrosporum]|uniref:Uncharacterized protein n=1 Tax=Hebeloma cylindrosporum TaxID=76867 RepID=A0A0C3CQT2_HEBCY|nr:hypothetical protein M413DRAFT_441548 [Hebeloma cylindrosporum h7]
MTNFGGVLSHTNKEAGKSPATLKRPKTLFWITHCQLSRDLKRRHPAKLSTLRLSPLDISLLSGDDLPEDEANHGKNIFSESDKLEIPVKDDRYHTVLPKCSFLGHFPLLQPCAWISTVKAHCSPRLRFQFSFGKPFCLLPSFRQFQRSLSPSSYTYFREWHMVQKQGTPQPRKTTFLDQKQLDAKNCCHSYLLFLKVH